MAALLATHFEEKLSKAVARRVVGGFCKSFNRSVHKISFLHPDHHILLTYIATIRNHMPTREIGRLFLTKPFKSAVRTRDVDPRTTVANFAAFDFDPFGCTRRAGLVA